MALKMEKYSEIDLADFPTDYSSCIECGAKFKFRRRKIYCSNKCRAKASSKRPQKGMGQSNLTIMKNEISKYNSDEVEFWRRECEFWKRECEFWKGQARARKNDNEDGITSVPDDTCSLQRAAEILGISMSFLKTLIRKKLVVTYKLGIKRTFVSPNQIRSLINL